jgi:uncharacterized protein YfaS (alpha-2-macroglobulin family)
MNNRPRLLILLAILLVGGGAAVFLAARSFLDRGSNGNGDGPDATPGTTIEIIDTNQTTAGLGAAGQEAFLRIRLSKGQAAPETAEELTLVTGTPLAPAELQQILDRLPPLETSEADVQEFQLPVSPLPPPLSGTTIPQSFPAPDVAATPATPTAGSLEVVRYAPEGEIPLAPFLNVTFNQPMVPLATLEELAAADVPVRLTPAIPGAWKWIGTQTLTFEYQGGQFDRFPMATQYTVEIPAGTQSAVGGVLAEAVTFTFTTPPPTLVNYYPTSGPHPLDPIIFMAFDQRVDPAAVLATTQVTADGSPISVRLATGEEIAADENINYYAEAAEDGRWLALRATEPLPQDSQILVSIGPGTPSAEGPLTTEGAQSFTFFTYAALRIDDHQCSWGDECPPLTPFYITFNNPLDAAAFDQTMLTIDPELPGARVSVVGTSLTIEGATRGRTTYEVTVSAAVKDIFGQTLGRDEDLRFRVGSAPGALSGPSQSLVTLDPSSTAPLFTIYSINYSRLNVTVYAVEPSDWPAYQNYLANQYQDNPPSIPGREVMDESIDIEGEDDVLTETAIDLSDALDGDFGHLIVKIEPPANLFNRDEYRPKVEAWVQVTHIGLDAFADHSQMVAWATNLADGAPLNGVNLTLGSVNATTAADGTARLELPGSSILLIGQQGEDIAILPRSTYYWGTEGWTPQPISDELRWYLFDDRQMYRPGEELHLKGWLRRIGGRQTGDVSLLNGAVTSVNYQVIDPLGNELLTGTAPVSALDGFDLAFIIPDNANLGSAYINFTASGNTGSLNGVSAGHSFQIQEFRRPEFEVTARNETAGPYFVGEGATVAVSAQYYAGGPLPNAETTWTVTSSPSSYAPPNWPDFTFGKWTPWWYVYDYGFDRGMGMVTESYSPYGPIYDSGQVVETFTGVTDAGGEHYLQLDFEAASEPQPFSVMAQASVMDVNRQAWAATTTLLVHPADLYVGLRGSRTFVQPGEPLDIELIVTDLDGNAIPGRTVQVRAARLEWAFRDGNWGEEEVEVQECSVISAAEASTCAFTTSQGGTYQITATVTDDLGRLNLSQLTRWVSGGQRPPARNVELEQLTLIPDKETYQPGDTAEILVQSPFSPAEGIMTVSRSGILYTERFTLTDGSATLRVPLSESQIPNVYVQVDIVGSAPRTDDTGAIVAGAPPRPAYATGGLNLNISLQSRTLNVEVSPLESRMEPGAQTAVDVVVTDGNGQPVAGAEVALVVVDEAVLALTNYQLTDPLLAFYTSRWSGIESTYGRSSIVLVNPLALNNELARQNAAGGGDADDGLMYAVEEEAVMDMAAEPAPTMTVAGEGAANQAPDSQPITVRTNFNPLALFAPAATTGPDGRAQVSFQLPDNLTRYRVMAVAVAGGQQFGSGESNLTARLPLMVRPSAPRFLNFGDQFELPVILQNQTDADMTVDVVIETTNLALTGNAGLRVLVPANNRIEVRFPATTVNVGTARFQVAAVSGSYADAATIELPVYTPATTEAFATYGVIDEGSIVQPVLAPQNVYPQFGGLEITTSSTALQALTDAVLYLTSYRYECSEQLASRILGVAALRDVLTAFEAEGLPTPEAMEAAVQRDIERLQSMQNWDGGFPIWEFGDESIPYYSIHVAHALVRAEEKGFTVPADTIQRVQEFLRNIENYYHPYYSQEVRWSLSAYALYVRHLMGDSDVTKATNLFNEAGVDRLSLEASAWLWPILQQGGRTAEVEAIIRHLNNRAVETAGAANFTTSYGDQQYLMLHSDRRTDAIILEALIANQPDSDLIPKVVNGLLAHRTAGRWENTQENVFVLLALDRYFNTFEAQTPDFVARVWLGPTYAGSHEFAGRTTERYNTNIPMSYVVGEAGTTQDLILSKEGPGRLYYRLGLRYAPNDLTLDPLDMGFVVARTYEAVDDPADVTQDENGVWHIRAGARVRVRLTMVASNRRYHVALVDPLPAGLEIINPALAVSGSVPQDPNDASYRYGWWWWGTWYDHQAMRDDRAEAFTTLLWEGVYEYSYVARATTPGTFVVPPAKAEEMYSPEVFGRSGTDTVIVE